MRTPFHLAVAGKGGTGKTTLCALLIRALVEAGEVPVLAVDADPNANLHEALGVVLQDTIGGFREEAFNRSIPPGMTRPDFIRMRFHQALVESEGFDLIAMGRPQGQGCYCFANDLLAATMRSLERQYRFIVADNEAGMEHISRGTIGVPDLLLLVTDPGARGIHTAVRIAALARDARIPPGRIRLVINRWRPGEALTEDSGIPVEAVLPEDPAVHKADLSGQPVAGISRESPVYCEVRKIADRVRSMAARGNYRS